MPVKPPQVNVQHLISFYFVAKEQSFSVAAEKLFITQPAVTQQIKALEAQFSVKLINVRRKRVHLTPAGQLLVSHAEEVIKRVTVAENFLKSYHISNFSIGVSTMLMLYITPLIDKFKELFPSAMVSVRQGPSLALVEDLLDYRFDVCFVGTLQAPSEKLRVIRYPEVEKMVLVASPDYPLARSGPIRWEALVNYPLIIQSEGSTARETILSHFASRSLTPLIGAEVDNVDCTMELARQKKGVALMFYPYVRGEVADGKLKIIPIIDGEIRLGIDIVRNAEASPSPVLRAFLNLVESQFAHLLSHEVAGTEACAS
jgi:DNA-binding transcriptional LysR family regulator